MKEPLPANFKPTWAIEAEELTKSFGHRLALRGINLKVARGEFFIIFGPNGAGKTTLIKILATLSKPSSGSVRIAGLDLKKSPAEIRHQIGVVCHQTYLYDNLTAYENLRFYGRMYDVTNVEKRIQQVANYMGLVFVLKERMGTLSRGMQQRLSIARAIIHNPEILLLDEPETGLDQNALLLFEDLLTSFRRSNKTLVMTTHNPERGLKMADRVIILAQGKVVYEETKPDVATFKRGYLCEGVRY